jgi:hypothetical protein
VQIAYRDAAAYAKWAGNVWPWCSDWYRPDYCQRLKLAGVVVARNPRGRDSTDNPAGAVVAGQEVNFALILGVPFKP